MFYTPTENTCEEFRQYDDDKPTPCYAATYYGLRDADGTHSRNKGESIYPPATSEENEFPDNTKIQLSANYELCLDCDVDSNASVSARAKNVRNPM